MSATLQLDANVDVTDPAFKANPFPFYARLRADAPVYPVLWRARKQRVWLVTRYADVLAALKDERLVKDPHNALTPAEVRQQQPWMVSLMFKVFAPLQHSLLNIDGADHDRLRALVHQAFTLRRIEQMRDTITAVATDLLDKAERKGQMDVVTDYALPLPLTVIGQIMGVPAADNDRFHRWTTAVLAAGNSTNPVTIIPSALQLMRYLRGLIRARARHPQDDLTSALVQARETGDRLSDDEILAMLFLLLSAGHETTVNLIATGTLALLEHPDQMTRLANEPDIAKLAIEELLRYVCPAEMATERYAREDIVIAGTTIPRGALVELVLASANRDPQIFENPDVLDLTRAPNKHLAFGQGIHFCLGAPLSRLEGQIALPVLVQRFPGLRLAVPPDQLRWRKGFVLRGVENLPLTW